MGNGIPLMKIIHHHSNPVTASCKPHFSKTCKNFTNQQIFHTGEKRQHRKQSPS